MKKTLILSIVVLVIIAGIMLTIVNIDMYTQIPKESDTATLS